MLLGSYKYLVIPFLLVAVSSIVILFPGSYSIDSVQQFDQVAGNPYNDWHSPVLAFVWKILYVITGKYYSIYLVQMILYWVFAYLLLFRAYPSYVTFFTGIVLCAFFVFIPQYVMKDAHIVIAWGIASMLLVLIYRSTNRKFVVFASIIAVLFIVYGTVLRLNNLAGAFVLFYLLADVSFPGKAGYVRKLGLSVLLCTVTILGTNIFSYKILDAEKRYPEYKLMLLDIAGISYLSGIDYIPEEVKRDHFRLNEFMHVYTPASFDDIYWAKTDSEQVVRNNPDEALNEITKKHWWKAVSENPVHYFENRWAGFTYFLRLKQRFHNDEYWNMPIHISENYYDIKRDNWNVISSVFVFHYYLCTTKFFAPWVWVLINILLVIYCIRRYNRTNEPEYRLQVLLQLSGIILIVGMVFVYQHDRDFRYSYWNVTLAIIGIVHCLYLTRKLKLIDHPITNTDNGKIV